MVICCPRRILVSCTRQEVKWSGESFSLSEVTKQESWKYIKLSFSTAFKIQMGDKLKEKTALVPLGINSTHLWNCTWGMNNSLSKDINSNVVFMLVVEILPLMLLQNLSYVFIGLWSVTLRAAVYNLYHSYHTIQCAIMVFKLGWCNIRGGNFHQDRKRENTKTSQLQKFCMCSYNPKDFQKEIPCANRWAALWRHVIKRQSNMETCYKKAAITFRLQIFQSIYE